MQLRVLAVGDVVGDCGVEFLHRHLPALRKLHEVHFTVVNGENAACNGLLPRQAEEIFAAGADVITMGNHTWDKQQITAYMDNSRYLTRPAGPTGPNRTSGSGTAPRRSVRWGAGLSGNCGRFGPGPGGDGCPRVYRSRQP